MIHATGVSSLLVQERLDLILGPKLKALQVFLKGWLVRRRLVCCPKVPRERDYLHLSKYSRPHLKGSGAFCRVQVQCIEHKNNSTGHMHDTGHMHMETVPQATTACLLCKCPSHCAIKVRSVRRCCALRHTVGSILTAFMPLHIVCSCTEALDCSYTCPPHALPQLTTAKNM